jgi:hypothetical protein
MIVAWGDLLAVVSLLSAPPTGTATAAMLVAGPRPTTPGFAATRPVDRATDPSAAPTSRAIRHSLYIELLGNGGFYSLNYEARLPFELTLRGGASYLGASATGETARGRAGLVSVPMMIGALPGFREHRLEVAAGATLFWFSGEASVLFVKAEMNEVLAMGTATIGYRYTPASGGIVLRAGFTPLFAIADGVRVLPWGGVSVGGTLD